ncbi:MAG: HK97 family phage prohead protease, partial [Verrucomicrobiota bacterium]
MAAEYRAPKNVQQEFRSNPHLAISIDQPLTIEQVVEIRDSWNGEHGLDWANRIVGNLMKGIPMTEKRDVGAEDTAADLFTVITTALDALQDLLGLSDDDLVSDVEANSGDKPTTETRTELETEMVEERKTLLATAERITMSAEIRAVATDDGSLKIAGYAATFDTEAENLNFREKIAPGAFTRSLESSDPIFLLVNHQTEQLP